MPVTYLPGLSSYVSSKLAQAKLYEFLAAENPNVFVATIHPGMVETDNFNRTGASPENLPMDKGKDFIVILTTFAIDQVL
jgi:NAD(P)-dependent dehydrogenase (short-subunit alcohol dehydrogenase family)